MQFKTLYKRTSTGKVQIWRQEVEGSRFRTISGQLNGKLVTSEWTECLPKNIGKANETTAEEQAILEVEATYKKKLARDYFENIEDIDQKRYFSPMLAKEYDEYFKKIVFPLFSQPKLDGVRCVISKKGMFTREGKPIVSCPHIFEQIKNKLTSSDQQIDGELYNHEFKDDFNSLVSMIKKIKPTSEDLALSEKFCQFHVYDYYDDRNLIFSERFNYVQLEFAGTKYLEFVRTDFAKSQDQLDACYAEYQMLGYEGQMIRNNVKYQSKRTKDLLKRKDFLEDEFFLVDVKSGIGNWTGCAKIATIEVGDKTCDVGVAGTMEFTRNILQNKENYIGKWVVVRYQDLTPDGALRFGVVKDFDRMDLEDEPS